MATPSPLADPTYRRLFTAQVTALLGSGFTSVALALLAYDLAGGAAGVVLGTALAIKMIAYVGVAPIAGAVAARVPRRALLIGLDLARAGVVACLPLVSAIWQIYALIFLLQACSAAFTPTFQATIPDVLPEEERYTRALSLSRLAYDLESLLSPALAALALTVLSYDALFAANGLAFLLSAWLVSRVRLPGPQPRQRAAGLMEELAFGLRAYLRTPRLRALLALSFAVASAGAMVIVNTVVYVRDVLGGGEVDTAIVFACAGAGSMVVALALPRLLDHVSDRSVMLSGGVLAASAIATGVLGPGFNALAIAWLVAGAGTSLIMTPAGRVLRRSCREGDRAAFFASQFALSHACWLVTYPLAGWLGAGVGPHAAFAVLAVLAIAATGLAWMIWPSPDPREIEHEHLPMQHRHPHVHDEHHRHAHEGWEGPEPHVHPHRHGRLRHAHMFAIDQHHPIWPR